MAAGWAMHLWNKWSIQILVLLSFTLQLFILTFARKRQRSSRTWRFLLWLSYLLADTTALYTLGHISNSQLPELRPAAFWAQFLLLHLGGQDTMTAYSLEDNQLWLRHLLTLVLQALGAAYMFYRHIADGGKLLVMAAVLVYLVGIMKYGERVWALKSSSHDGITSLLDKVELDESDEPQGSPRRSKDDQDWIHVDVHSDDAENVLRDAHELLPICMGQFVDYKFRPCMNQIVVICKHCRQRDYLFELTGMQLSLMHDIFYTKAVVIHTWYGCCNRALSLVAVVAAVLLFTFKADKGGYTRVDVVFTYILLGGAIGQEMTSVLRAIGSSWTCAIFVDKNRSSGFSVTRDWLHTAVMCFRGRFKLAERRRKRSWSVGQHNLLELFTLKQDFRSRIASMARLENWLNKRRITSTLGISADSQELMRQDIERIVRTCQAVESRMWGYRGQAVLTGWSAYNQDPTGWCIEIDFVESILAWHVATNLFLSIYQSVGTSSPDASQQDRTALIKKIEIAIKMLSNYMMFLLVDHPYLLPSPVRARQYELVYRWLSTAARSGHLFPSEILARIDDQTDSPGVLGRASILAKLLLDRPEEHLEKLEKILGVWMEMLCYAASNCSRDSHARQLNSGAELITAVWILQTTIYYHINSDANWLAHTRREFLAAHGMRVQ